jgi:hypothetical protein
MDPLTIGLGAAALGGALFGKNKSTPQQTGASGLAAMPPELRHAYIGEQGFLPGAREIYANPYQGTPMGQAPTGPWASQAEQELQNYSNQNGGIFAGGTGVHPLGAVEPFNPYQQNALSQFGQGYGNFQENQGQYMNPYQQMVLNQLASGGWGMNQQMPGYMNPWLENILRPTENDINRQADISKGNLSDYAARFGGIGANNSSAYAQQLQGIDRDRERAIEQARGNETKNAYGQALGQYNLGLSGLFQGGGQAYDQANQMRRQSLQDMLNAGTAIQQQGQQQANAIQPQLQQTTPQGRLGQFGQNLNMIPGSQTSTGYTQQPNAWSQIGGLGLTGLGFMSGQGANQGIQNLGGAMPWLNNGGGNVGTYGQTQQQRSPYSLY